MPVMNHLYAVLPEKDVDFCNPSPARINYRQGNKRLNVHMM